MSKGTHTHSSILETAFELVKMTISRKNKKWWEIYYILLFIVNICTEFKIPNENNNVFE